MLQIREITKTYRTGALVQRALDGVTLNFRDCEFMAILGPSGSGKTTLLNVLGGLDRYDGGELIINGVSTVKYKNRDWDAYRNHSVGFVFQSYNLIPHQTVLANVELALTIGGIRKKERVRRAAEALERVGLGEHIHKKPSQLSGGQMQRVAIARALVNDPDILLADEPTGALDSDTSIQVMDLLKEVASDRLVVMVTHNPELAERYATRIVRLKDGRIVDDTDPYLAEDRGERAAAESDAQSSKPEEEPEGREPAAGDRPRKRRASMSFITALDLSLKNLWTKKVRTLLVAFAGSIGIIGIAAILSMSHGANTYIRNIQEETLKSYPLTITDTSFDLTAMLGLNGAADKDDTADGEEKPEVREWKMMTTMLSRVTKNDMKSLREYIENGAGKKIYDYSQAVEYGYNVTPQIYALRGDTVRQVHPDRSFAALGISITDTMNGMLTGMSAANSFFALPEDPAIYRNGYDLKAGRWPEEWNECVLVLSKNGMISDLTLFALGLRDPADLDALVKAFAEGTDSHFEDEKRTYDYADFLGIGFKLIRAADKYVYDAERGVCADRSGDPEFMRRLVGAGEDISIVGVVQPSEGNDSPLMNIGVGYPAGLVLHLMEGTAEKDAVKAQLAHPETDVFTGKKFGDLTAGEVDMSTFFNIDRDALSGMLAFDPDALKKAFSDLDLSGLDLGAVDISSFLDLSALRDVSLPGVSEDALTDLLSLIRINATADDLRDALGGLIGSYLEYASADPATDYARLTDAVKSFLESDAAREVTEKTARSLADELSRRALTREEIRDMLTSVFAGLPAYMADHPADTESDPLAYINGYLESDYAKQKLGEAEAELKSRFADPELAESYFSEFASGLYNAYCLYAAENGLPDISRMSDSFSEYLSSEEGRNAVTAAASRLIDASALEERVKEMYGDVSDALAGQIASAIRKASAPAASALKKMIASKMGAVADRVADYMKTALDFDPAVLADAFQMKMSAAEMRDLMTTMLSTDQGTYESNLRKLGYATVDDPASITIYPIDFEGKTEIKNVIDGYNDAVSAAGEDGKVIVYTDVVETLMSSVTEIINAISIILIAFVAVSLVVSSVMIGVITYISVLERRKEIGILRAIGASKRNVSNVFNAETFIIGALAGVLGIVVTALLIIPTNSLLHSLTGRTDVNAILPPVGAALLILLSIVLTLIGGIIPSRKAARSDPVAALREN